VKWIIDNNPYLKNYCVQDLEAEHKIATKLLKKFQPIGNQCLYGASYFDEKLFYVSDSVEQVIGYSKEEVTELDFFYSLIHPNDIDTVKRMTLYAFSTASEQGKVKSLDHVFHLTFRMKRKDGTYIKVQRQTSILTEDENGTMLTSYGILTDITHLNNSEEIQSLLVGPEIPGFSFTDPESSPKVNLTRREKEMIDLLANGLNSEEIAKKLYISKETVYTHRKNILAKTGVNNSAELMAFVFKNGY
jgi:PAS domain S-box-containing protein